MMSLDRTVELKNEFCTHKRDNITCAASAYRWISIISVSSPQYMLEMCVSAKHCCWNLKQRRHKHGNVETQSPAAVRNYLKDAKIKAQKVKVLHSNSVAPSECDSNLPPCSRLIVPPPPGQRDISAVLQNFSDAAEPWLAEHYHNPQSVHLLHFYLIFFLQTCELLKLFWFVQNKPGHRDITACWQCGKKNL